MYVCMYVNVYVCAVSNAKQLFCCDMLVHFIELLTKNFGSKQARLQLPPQNTNTRVHTRAHTHTRILKHTNNA